MARPCIDAVNVYDSGPTTSVMLYACDVWAVPHIIAPFLITIFTRSWKAGIAWSLLGELAEYFALWAFNSFIIFLGTHKGVDLNHDIENMTGSYVEDALIQGILLGTILLGTVFYNTFSFPVLVDTADITRKRVLTFLYYVFMLFGMLIIVPAALYNSTIGTFKLGVNLAPVIHGLTILFILWTQPKSVWASYSWRERFEFWGLLWFISLVMHVQNQFDWFFSSAVQSWVITGAFFLFMIPIGVVRWLWPWRIYVSFIFEW